MLFLLKTEESMARWSDIEGFSPGLRLQKWGAMIVQRETNHLRWTAPAPWCWLRRGLQSFAYWHKLNLKIAVCSPNQTNHCNAVSSFGFYFQSTTLNHPNFCSTIFFCFRKRLGEALIGSLSFSIFNFEPLF